MSNQTGPNEAPLKGIDKQPVVALGAEPSSPGHRGARPLANRAGAFRPSGSIFQTMAGNPGPVAAPAQGQGSEPVVTAPSPEPLEGLPSVSLSGPGEASGSLSVRGGRSRPQSAAATLVGQGLSPALREEIRQAIGKSVVPTQPCSVPQAGKGSPPVRSEGAVLGQGQPGAAASRVAPEQAARRRTTPPPRKLGNHGLSGMAGPQSEPIPLFRSTRLLNEVRAELLAEQGYKNSQPAITDSLPLEPRIVEAAEPERAGSSSIGTDTDRQPIAGHGAAQARGSAGPGAASFGPAASRHNPYRALVEEELRGAQGGRAVSGGRMPVVPVSEEPPARERSKVVRWTFTALLAAGTIALFVEQILAAP